MKVQIKIDSRNTVAKKSDNYHITPLLEKYISRSNFYTYEEAFDLVFSRNKALKKIAANIKDKDEFKSRLNKYKNGKLGPSEMIELYNICGRSYFTRNIIWGFWFYGFDFRSDHMKKYGKIPNWIIKKSNS